MRPVTLMTHPHLLSLLLSLNKGLSSYLPMALGNFAHNYGQSCIVVRHHSSLSLSLTRVPYYYIYSTFANGELQSF